MSGQGHGNKGDANTRIDPKKYKENREKVDFSKPVSTKGFKMRINGKVVK